MGEAKRTTFVFSNTQLISSVSDNVHHFHHFEFYQLFFMLEYQVSTWVLKMKTVNIFLMLKIKGSTLIF